MFTENKHQRTRHDLKKINKNVMQRHQAEDIRNRKATHYLEPLGKASIQPPSSKFEVTRGREGGLLSLSQLWGDESPVEESNNAIPASSRR